MNIAGALVLLVVMFGATAALADDGGTCTPPQIECDSACTDPTSDPMNCGVCGMVCESKLCSGGSCVPLECDGGLCDTSYGATCDMSPRAAAPRPDALWVAGLVVFALLVRRRRAAALAGALAVVLAPQVARAAAPGPVDVAIHDEPPPRRYVSIAWNPVPVFTIGKLSFDVVIAPVNHHALVLSPFYVSTSTVPFDVPSGPGGSPAYQLPKQSFEGWGGEIGYRYYFGLAGPRGAFVGASFILGSFNVTAQDTSQLHYWSFGGAIDAGYQMLVASRVSLAAGLGVQYTATDKTLPTQQWPAKIYANDGFNPRLLVAIGWAF